MTKAGPQCGAVALVCTLLFACAAPTGVAPSAIVSPTLSAESPTTGGDGSSTRLAPISSAEAAAAQLAGELGCSFSRGGDLLLLAMGDVASKEPAFGIVKVGDYLESVSSPRGFDGMLKGATFIGRGKSIRIELTSGTPLGGGESPPFAAKLTYLRADGASHIIDGLWTCGP